MITLQHPIKKIQLKEFRNLLKNEAHPLNKPETVCRNNLSVFPKPLNKEVVTRFQSPLFKRLSPFLLAVPVLTIIFGYQLVTGTGAVHNDLLLLILFPFAITNVLFIDFFLWNYFAGKKKVVIWSLELFAIIIAVYLFF